MPSFYVFTQHAQIRIFDRVRPSQFHSKRPLLCARIGFELGFRAARPPGSVRFSRLQLLFQLSIQLTGAAASYVGLNPMLPASSSA